MVAAADSPGRFAHVLQRARDDRAEQRRRQQAGEAIAGAGLTVLEGRALSYDASGPARLLRDLADRDGQPLTAAAHASCPGHAAYVGERYGYWTAEQAAHVALDDTDDGQRWPDTSDDDDQDDEEPSGQGEGVAWRGRYAAVYVCTDHAAHGHQPRWTRGGTIEELTATGAEADARKEAAREQRRVTIDNNKAWRSAETVRRGFLGVLLGRKTPPKGAAVWVARQLAHGHQDYTKAAGEGHPLACELFGVELRQGFYTATPDGLLSLLEGAPDARAQMVTLGLVLAACEAATDVHSWRNPTRSTAAHLRFLADQGYTLSEVERLACDDRPGGDGHAE